MERRREPRFETDRAILATVLTDPQILVDGRIVNQSGQGLQLLLNQAVPTGAAVRIDLDDALFLGEVTYCRSDGTDYRAGLRLDHVLYDVPGVLRLMRAILGAEGRAGMESGDATPEVSSARTRR